ncbi:DNA-3-methyladenine glycosylase II [Pacificibacter maritimus]|uniref:DNA-3-methyladenine glycosylase II n=1 Tax=Pacificibacter maritimus TaxID=762213 RepID=A0A3N4VF70_9RHOB|nr:DNA-3-methyladenine glycosylase [Pacificibacter maritimus]RPE71554.1 DNA-3-methyladenine glycosylase II [Pacificibacter maritimus]
MGRLAGAEETGPSPITCQADVDRAAERLAGLVPQFCKAYALTGPLPLRLRKDGFGELASAIVSQQVSVASANAIWARVCAAGYDRPAPIIEASDDALRACGLSRPKVKYLRALAEANIDFIALRSASTDEVIDRLTQVKGIGRWTAEIYAKFSLGHADVFAANDLALQEGARLLFELPQRPTEKQMRLMAEDWAPDRSVAARLLWAYYHVEKTREGIR